MLLMCGMQFALLHTALQWWSWEELSRRNLLLLPSKTGEAIITGSTYHSPRSAQRLASPLLCKHLMILQDPNFHLPPRMERALSMGKQVSHARFVTDLKS